MAKTVVLTTSRSEDYELLDSGDGEKLERYGSYILLRPDPQALWPKKLPDFAWKKTDAVFERGSSKTDPKKPAPKTGWHNKSTLPKEWNISFGELTFTIRPTPFKHTGLFPEQLPNWQWIEDCIASADKQVSVLNLFGYTGGATLAAARAGAAVTHVDGSKVAITWAKENAKLSGLENKPIRWILDDAKAFVKREIKRGKKYDAIIMDPPAFGHGPKQEPWKIEDDLIELFTLCKSILVEQPLFFLVNGYASGYSPLSYYNNMDAILGNKIGTIECGELTIQESGTGRLLSAGIFARWSSNNTGVRKG